MPDLLVPLYRLPDRAPGETALANQGIIIRRPNTFESTPVLDFIRKTFSQGWADETAAAFSRMPITAFIATHEGRTIGFGTYESTRRGFFGPTGVNPDYRGKGIGSALLIACLWGMADMGYAYGIIGAAGPVDFYRRAVNAIEIPDSTPGIYVDLLKRD